MTGKSGVPVRELQLATLVDTVPEGDAWLHEQKFDGYRILAHREGARVTLWSRRWKDWTAAFPSVAEAVAALPARRLTLDGEVAVVLPDGRTSFQALQNAFGPAWSTSRSTCSRRTARTSARGRSRSARRGSPPCSRGTRA